MIGVRVVLLVLCHACCAFFAGMETGVVSINRMRLLHLARGGDSRARLLAQYIRDPDRFLGTLLVGGNLASVAISTLAAGIAWSLWGARGLGLSSAVSTATILVFGEFLPKAWFGSRPLSRCLPFARLLRATELVLLPTSKLFVSVAGLFVPVSGTNAASGRLVTREHLQWLARNSEAGGLISPLEGLMINRALALQAKTALDVMTPMDAVVTLAPDSQLADVSALVAKTGHGKFPVIDKATGKCFGVLHVQDVLARISGNPDDAALEFARKPFYVRSSARADDILPLLRRNGQRLGVVRDKSGRLCGIVTIDAMLATIVGNIPRDTTGDRKADKDAPVVFNAAGKEM